MLGTLLKILLFVAAVSALAFGASLALDTGNGLRLAIGGWEFTLGPLQALIGIAVLLLALWLVLKVLGLLFALFRFLNGDETAISRYFDQNLATERTRSVVPRASETLASAGASPA